MCFAPGGALHYNATFKSYLRKPFLSRRGLFRVCMLITTPRGDGQLT
jgi:hypothetical protein